MDKNLNLLRRSLMGIAILSLAALLAIYFHNTAPTEIGIILIVVFLSIFVAITVLVASELLLMKKESKSNVPTETGALSRRMDDMENKLKDVVTRKDLEYQKMLLDHDEKMAEIKYQEKQHPNQ